MTLKRELFRRFEALGNTVPVRELNARSTPNMIALRHDIDHSLDVALETAFWEHRAGMRATYYLLDTAGYWEDPRFIDKCLQLVDFGHEVGLHLNVLAKWFAGEIDDVEADILRSLDRLRSAGIEVSGVAAHGDARCYADGFINYWCLSELRPVDPRATETGLSAEGIAAPSARHSIVYPEEDVLTRADGRRFSLWSVDMAGLGLDYDAMHVPMDRYFTDSGGDWTRSPDPLTQDLRLGRHQVLIHPIHWRELPQKIFFLSTARSASTWLARVIDEASSARGAHEFSLNHRFDGSTPVSAKRTFGDLDTLLSDDAEVDRLLREARDYMETLPEDWAEANVYLVHFLDALREVFPDATLVHLHRDPHAVVDSLVARGWYDTPDDPLHPPLRDAGSRAATAFERVCHYVAETNETLLRACVSRIACEQMTTDRDYLGDVLAELGIAFYPRLAGPMMGKRLNASTTVERADWSADERAAFGTICGPIASRLGYGGAGAQAAPRISRRPRRPERRWTILRLGDAHGTASLTEKIDAFIRTRLSKQAPVDAAALERLAVTNCDLEAQRPISLRLIPGRHGHLLFGGGVWNKLSAGEGFDCAPGRWFSGTMELAFDDDMSPALYCLSHDADGTQIDRKLLAVFGRHAMRKSFAFRPRASSSRFNLVLYFSAAEVERHAAVTSVLLEEVR